MAGQSIRPGAPTCWRTPNARSSSWAHRGSTGPSYSPATPAPPHGPPLSTSTPATSSIAPAARRARSGSFACGPSPIEAGCHTALLECCVSTGLTAGLAQVVGAVDGRRNRGEPGGAGEAEPWIETHHLFDDVDFLLTRVHHSARRSGGGDGSGPVAVGDARLAELAEEAGILTRIGGGPGGPPPHCRARVRRGG